MDNIKFWVRNREKRDPFYLQGWRKGKFYPDFLARTLKGNTLVLEWKGEHLKSNFDSQYKESLGNLWAKLDNGKLHFFWVTKDNIQEALDNIKKL